MVTVSVRLKFDMLLAISQYCHLYVHVCLDGIFSALPSLRSCWPGRDCSYFIYVVYLVSTCLSSLVESVRQMTDRISIKLQLPGKSPLVLPTCTRLF